MSNPTDVRNLYDNALTALRAEARSVGGAWSKDPFQGTKYRAAEFTLKGEGWVVVEGDQSPDYARLLDGTAGLMAHRQCERGIAILHPPPGPPKHGLPDDRYLRRFRAAAWNGLGIVWCTPEDVTSWAADLAVARPELDAITDAVTRRLQRTAQASWARITKSKGAEELVRPIVDEELTERGFTLAAKKFPSYWRNAEADGAWERPGGVPDSLALEVKVDEDSDAPFGQLVDDLGHFDAALQIRFIRTEATRHALRELPGIVEAHNRFEANLPARVIYVRFCAICSAPLGDPELAYPYLVCAECDQTAVDQTPGGRYDYIGDDGPNPVLIQGKLCWRRYSVGRHWTMLDPDNCESLESYLRRNTRSG